MCSSAGEDIRDFRKANVFSFTHKILLSPTLVPWRESWHNP